MNNNRRQPLLKQVRYKSIYQLTAEMEYKKGKSIKTIAEEMKESERQVREWVKS